MENFWYLLAAYSIVWAFVFAFLLILASRQKRIERELGALKNAGQKR